MRVDWKRGLTYPRPFDTFSRRRFLRGAAALALAESVTGSLPGRRVLGAGLESGARSANSILAYVGTYSSPQGPEGSKGRGEGIYLFEMNPATGALTERQVFANDSNPAWIAFDPSRTHLYSANETATFEGQDSGSVSAYTIDRSSGRLTLLNTVGSGAAGPAHLSVHPSGRYVLAANYAGGAVAVLPVLANGGLGAATDVKHDRGVVGPARAASAPRGSFAISGHDAPHAHMI